MNNHTGGTSPCVSRNDLRMKFLMFNLTLRALNLTLHKIIFCILHGTKSSFYANEGAIKDVTLL